MRTLRRVSFAAMQGDERASWDAILPAEPLRFAPDFAWGVTSSAFQAEGGDVPNDWVDAARAGRVPPNPGSGWERAEADLRLAAALGLGHYASPSSGAASSPRLAASTRRPSTYRAICDAARAAASCPGSTSSTSRTRAGRGARRLLARAGRTPSCATWSARRALAGHARHFTCRTRSMAYVSGGYLIGGCRPSRAGASGLRDDAVVLELRPGATRC
jgi:hypothetical protein